MKVRLEFKPRITGTFGGRILRDIRYKTLSSKKEALIIIKEVLKKYPKTEIYLSHVKNIGKGTFATYPLEKYFIENEKLIKIPFYNFPKS